MLVYAFHEGAPRHREYRQWLQTVASSSEPVGLSELVLSGFLRVATHPRVFAPPAPIEQALAFVTALRDLPQAIILTPGPRHWSIFAELCLASDVKGNLVADAYLAALAIESGSEWITTDRDFSRFRGLRWRHPLASA